MNNKEKYPRKITDFFKQSDPSASTTAPSPALVPELEESSQPVSKKPRVHVSVPCSPNQPTSGFSFPSTDGRRCIAKHFTNFRWLHYVQERDEVVCHTCCVALERNLVNESEFKETAFIVGFRNWKKIPAKYLIHEKSEMHKKCQEKLLNLKLVPVVAQISRAHEVEQKRRQIAFIEVIGTIRVLAQQGMALRGHEDFEGNLNALLRERATEVKELEEWIKRRDNLLSHDMQNELLEIMAHSVQRNLVAKVTPAPFFGVIADGTTDISGREQFSVCIRYGDNDLKTHEIFLGLYEPPDATGETLYKTIKDVFVRLGLDWTKLRWQCFDGGSNMKGRLKGCQAFINVSQPLAMYIHCCNHSLDLVLVEEAKQIHLVADAVNCVKEISSCLRASASRMNLFSKYVEECSTDTFDSPVSPRLLAICPTRWTIRYKAFIRFLQNYDAVVKSVFDIALNSSALPDIRSKLRGYTSYLTKFETVFAMKICCVIFGPCEEFATLLQRQTMTATEALHGATFLTSHMKNLRTTESFENIYSEVISLIESLTISIKPPKAPRPIRPPQRIEYKIGAEPDSTIDANSYLRKSYFEALDLLISELERRFSQTGLKSLADMETILTDPQAREDEAVVKALLGHHIQDIKVPLLMAQLRMLPVLGNNLTSLKNVVEALQAACPTVRSMMSECIKLCQLILCAPSSVATAERSFSCLRRVKNHLRGTMGQARLTHLMLLNIHRQETQELRKKDVLREFVNRKVERIHVFGSC